MSKRRSRPLPGRITYEGFEKEHFIFRLHLDDCAAFAAYQFESMVSQWLIGNVQGFVKGNDFSKTPHLPQVDVYNPGKGDVFVLLRNMLDVAEFERTFSVEGVSPTALMMAA